MQLFFFLFPFLKHFLFFQKKISSTFCLRDPKRSTPRWNSPRCFCWGLIFVKNQEIFFGEFQPQCRFFFNFLFGLNANQAKVIALTQTKKKLQTRERKTNKIEKKTDWTKWQKDKQRKWMDKERKKEFRWRSKVSGSMSRLFKV